MFVLILTYAFLDEIDSKLSYKHLSILFKHEVLNLRFPGCVIEVMECFKNLYNLKWM